MGEMKHTPGPWQVDPNNPGDVNGPDGKDVALSLFAGMNPIEVTGKESTLAPIRFETAVANSRLISAAPELLEALELLLHDRTPWTVTCAKEAIAKATGEPT